jgi:cytosine deaminase
MQALASVLIPPRVRGFDDGGRGPGQAWHVALDGDRIAAIAPVDTAPMGTLLPAFADAHVHLDKTFTVQEVGAAQGDLFAAIARMAEHRATWTAGDLHRRMSQALEQAWRCGTRAMRTHLDWVERDAPPSLAVFERLRAEWADRIELQCVSLTPLDLFDDAFAGEDIALEVARVNAQDPRGRAAALGAFVYRNDRLEDKLRRLFDLAEKNQLGLDLHVDEGLHADAEALRLVAELAVRKGLRGRITCSHCCSLSVQPAARARDTLARCAHAQLALVGLPTTNLYLQGAWDGTPVERGLTRLREASEAGIRPCLASDNVADAFYPYGSYDLLETFALGVQVGHLAPATDWLDTITTSPARAMGLAWDGRIAPGCPADLVVLEAATDWDLLTSAGRRRIVIRHGQPL